MTTQEIFTKLTHQQAMALTAWGEARSHMDGGKWKAAPVQARLDIMSVIRNRYLAQRAQFGLTIKEVCLRRWQFSCWIPEGGAENFKAVMNSARIVVTPGEKGLDPVLAEALYLAEGVCTGVIRDSVFNATHYYANWMPKPPDWAVGKTPVVERFNHRFYFGIK